MFDQLYDNTGTTDSPDFVSWQSGSFPRIRCAVPALTGLAELAMRGYRRSAWGGVEAGGVLLGKREENAVSILGYRELDCEHEHGPAFELSERDFARLERLIADSVAEPGPRGLCVAGWFHSVSSRELAVTQFSRKLHDRFFREPWQICMILRRSKRDPLEAGWFHRDPTGVLHVHSPHRQFAVEDFRLKEAELPLDPRPEPKPPAPSPLAPPPEPSPASPQAETPAASLNPFEFLGLRQDPFSQHPDTQFFYPAPLTREALAILQHGVQRRSGFLSLIGEAGLGKSLVLECLIEHLGAQQIPFAYLFNSKVTVEQFFELLADDFDLQCQSRSKAAVLIALNERLVERSKEGLTTVLIIDNAQKLGMDVLEEVELLGNLETRRGKLLQVIFSGQPAFERLLDRPELRGLRQRMILRAQLAPLDQEHTGLYIASRLAKAGLASQSFIGGDLAPLIHLRTQGIPRLINAACGGLLQRAIQARRHTVDAGMLEEVCRTLDLNRLLAGQETEAQTVTV